MRIRLIFGALLDRRKITPNRLAQRHGLTRNTVYALANPQPGRVRLDLDVLAAAMSALEKETGEPVKLADVLEVLPSEADAAAATVTEPGDPQGYRALVGLFGVEDGPSDVSTNHDAYLGREAEQEYEAQTGRER